MDNLSKLFYSAVGFIPLFICLFLWLCAAFDAAISNHSKATTKTKICSGLSGVALIGWIVVLSQIWK